MVTVDGRVVVLDLIREVVVVPGSGVGAGDNNGLIICVRPKLIDPSGFCTNPAFSRNSLIFLFR